MILAGLTGCVFLLPGSRVLHGIGLDVHTLLYAFVSVLLGFQLVAFATFAKVFAITEGLLPEDPRFSRVFQWGHAGNRSYSRRVADGVRLGWIRLRRFTPGAGQFRSFRSRAHAPPRHAFSLLTNARCSDHL
jgi:hypothetical protein